MDLEVIWGMSFKKQRMQSVRTWLLAGSAWALFGQAAVVFFMIVIIGFLTRLLTPSEMGVYFLTLSFVSFAAIGAQLGLNDAVVRFVAETMVSSHPERTRAVIRNALLAATCGVGLVSGATLIFFPTLVATSLFRSPLMAGVTGLAALWVVAMAFQALLAAIFRGFRAIKLATAFDRVVSTVLSALFLTVLWMTTDTATLKDVLLVLIIASAISSSWAAVLLTRRLRRLEKGGTFPVATILRVSLPLLVYALMIMLLTEGYIWILGIFQPQDQVALYGAASRLAQLVSLPLVILNAVIPPLIAEMYANKRRGELQRILQAAATLASIPAAGAFVLLAVGGREILEIVFGIFYSQGYWILIILSCGHIFNVLAGSCGQALMMTGHHNAIMAISLLVGLSGMVGALLVVRPFGATGVATVSALVFVIQNVTMLVVVRRRAGLSTHATWNLRTIFDRP